MVLKNYNFISHDAMAMTSNKSYKYYSYHFNSFQVPYKLYNMFPN